MKKINPYLLRILLSLAVLIGLGTISIAPLWLAIIGIFWPLPLLKVTTKKFFFLTCFALASMLVIRTFVFSDFIGTLILIPYGLGAIAMLWSRLFNPRTTPIKELTIGMLTCFVGILIVLFYLSTILGFFQPLYLSFQLEQILQDNVSNQSEFLKGYLGQGNIIDKLDLLAFYTSKLLVGILIGVELLGITTLWHLGTPKEKQVPFNEWRGDYRFIWGLIIGLILLLGGATFNHQEMMFLGINILIIYSLFLFVLGLAALVDATKKLSLMIWAILGIIFFLAPPTLIIALIIGFINCFTKKNILRRT